MKILTYSSQKLPRTAQGRDTALAEMGYAPLFSLAQKHSDTVVRIKSPFRDTVGGELGQGDAIVTNQPGIFIGVKTADCVPILMYDGGVAAAVHAGWRGTAAGIAAKTVRIMSEEFGAEIGGIRALIGPCICKSCYETDGDVPAAMPEFAGEYISKSSGGKSYVDLAAINAALLRRAGVCDITLPEVCTRCNSDIYWSHRAHGTERGLQVSLIGII